VGFGSCRNNDALNSNELEILLWKSVHFETEFYGLAYPTIKLIQGLRLSVATGQRWHRGDVVSLCITLYDDVEITLQGNLPRSILSGRARLGPSGRLKRV
jgi:hypothetical protein